MLGINIFARSYAKTMTLPHLTTPANTLTRTFVLLRQSRTGMLLLAAVVGLGAGLGAVLFRELVTFFTWVFTGSESFGQNGYVGSSHFPWLGLAFFVVAPVVGGILYGPLVYRYAREARGHGVPEVMIAVAENGGKIRPQVSLVKAIASSLTIASGGSVGREGPIVQIGAALASSLGQWTKIPEKSMRILVACGAAGGIAATFNAPITGVFFGVEIILRELSVDALFPVMIAAMVADATAIPFLGNEHFLNDFPVGIALHNPENYLLIAALAVISALIGLAFTRVLYFVEDLCDRLWKGRPEWARPAVGGLFLGVLLLAIPQMYGVGYPVMGKAIAGNYGLWFLLILALAKILATSISLGIGGSGGIFAPSLFIGVASGMAFGIVVDHLFGPGAGSPVLYAVVAMGAVFTSAARAPLTSFASVVEMTGDFTLTLPVMLAVAVSTLVSRSMSYGTIYTIKLLRRGQDIDRTTPWRALGDTRVDSLMRPVQSGFAGVNHKTVPSEKIFDAAVEHDTVPTVGTDERLWDVIEEMGDERSPGFAVLSPDGKSVDGWLTGRAVFNGISAELSSGPSTPPTRTGPGQIHHEDSRVGVMIMTALGGSSDHISTLGSIVWPAGYVPVSLVRGHNTMEITADTVITPGDRVTLIESRSSQT